MPVTFHPSPQPLTSVNSHSTFAKDPLQLLQKSTSASKLTPRIGEIFLKLLHHRLARDPALWPLRRHRPLPNSHHSAPGTATASSTPPSPPTTSTTTSSSGPTTSGSPSSPNSASTSTRTTGVRVAGRGLDHGVLLLRREGAESVRAEHGGDGTQVAGGEGRGVVGEWGW